MKKTFTLFIVQLLFFTGSYSQSFDTLKTIILPNQYAIGVVFDNTTNQYIISTAGGYAVPGDHAFLRLDLNGTQVGSFSQNNSELLGFRDLTTDGTFIYGSYAKNVIKMDKATFTPLDTFPAPNGTCRGLSIEADGTFWESNSSSAEPLTHFDQLGTVISTCPSSTYTSEAPYGMALDTFSYPGTKWMWMATHAPLSPTYNGIHLTRYDVTACEIDTTIDLTSKVPGYTGTISSAGFPAGLHVMNDHPSYPGKVVALYVGRRNGGNSYLMLVDITPINDAVGENEQELVTYAYPNPFSSYTTLHVNTKSGGNYKVLVFDQLGRIVKSIENPATADIVIDKGECPAGIYFYTVEQHGKLAGSGKLIME